MNETISENNLSIYKNISPNSHNYSTKTKSVIVKDYLNIDSNNNTLLNFQHFLSNNYNLINKKEIIDFITIKPLLLDFIKNVTDIIKQEFSNNKLSMEFIQDPEIVEFRYIVIYIHSKDSSFNEDWETLNKINKLINKMDLLNNSMKKYILVDLW